MASVIGGDEVTATLKNRSPRIPKRAWSSVLWLRRWRTIRSTSSVPRRTMIRPSCGRRADALMACSSAHRSTLAFSPFCSARRRTSAPYSVSRADICGNCAMIWCRKRGDHFRRAYAEREWRLRRRRTFNDMIPYLCRPRLQCSLSRTYFSKCLRSMSDQRTSWLSLTALSPVRSIHCGHIHRCLSPSG